MPEPADWDLAWMRFSQEYTARLMHCSDRVERLEMLSKVPMFSIWKDVREELEEAAAEIRRLRRRVAELTDDQG